MPGQFHLAARDRNTQASMSRSLPRDSCVARLGFDNANCRKSETHANCTSFTSIRSICVQTTSEIWGPIGPLLLRRLLLIAVREHRVQTFLFIGRTPPKTGKRPLFCRVSYLHNSSASPGRLHHFWGNETHDHQKALTGYASILVEVEFCL
jgi:hypothetical protein